MSIMVSFMYYHFWDTILFRIFSDSNGGLFWHNGVKFCVLPFLGHNSIWNFSDPNGSLCGHNGLMFQISHFLVEGCNF